MTIRKVCSASLLSIAAVFGCDEPPEQAAPVGFGNLDAGSESSTVAKAVESPDASSSDAALTVSDLDSGRPLRTGPAYVAVSSDYSATSISILDAEGHVLADDYLNSGSTQAGLVTTLSGDVEVPTQSNDPGVLVLIDRFKTDVITRVRLADGAILGQVKTQTPSTQQTSTSYSSNPNDYVYIDETTAWVTRGDPNLDPDALPIDKGDDLFRINPSTMTRTGERIDLSVLDTTTTLKDPTTGMEVATPLYARPARMVRLGNTIVVGIARTSFNFSAVGDGAVALVDLTTKAVTGFSLEGMKNCSDVHAVPNDGDSVVIACSGDFNADDVRDTAGLVKLGLNGGTATVEQVWHAKGDSYAGALVSGAVALGGTLVAAGANDYAGKGADVFAVLDLATGKKTEVVSAAPGTGRFGLAAYDADSKILFVPDSSVDENKRPTSGIRRFRQHADGSFSELELTKVSLKTNMPVRGIWPL